MLVKTWKEEHGSAAAMARDVRAIAESLEITVKGDEVDTGRS